jgi:hypothetical protein
MSLQISTLLRTASPATWALLQSYGWSVLPHKLSPAEGTKTAVGSEGVEGSRAALMGEFEAEH